MVPLIITLLQWEFVVPTMVIFFNIDWWIDSNPNIGAIWAKQWLAKQYLPEHRPDISKPIIVIKVLLMRDDVSKFWYHWALSFTSHMEKNWKNIYGRYMSKCIKYIFSQSCICHIYISFPWRIIFRIRYQLRATKILMDIDSFFTQILCHIFDQNIY